MGSRVMQSRARLCSTFIDPDFPAVLSTRIRATLALMTRLEYMSRGSTVTNIHCRAIAQTIKRGA
jgi:hypothetical protein